MEKEDNLYKDCVKGGGGASVYITWLIGDKVRHYCLLTFFFVCVVLMFIFSSETTSWCDGIQKGGKWYENRHCASMVCFFFFFSCCLSYSEQDPIDLIQCCCITGI